MNESAYKFGEFLGKKLIEASQVNGSKRERILYPVASGLTSSRKTLEKIPDRLERYLALRDIKLGVDATIAAESNLRSHQTIKVLYQKLLHILDL